MLLQPPCCRDGSGAEYVLDYVLERKSSQDLAASIGDGRYATQKWRMLRCGLANRFYLVETEGDPLLRERNKKVGIGMGRAGQGRAGQHSMHVFFLLLWFPPRQKGCAKGSRHRRHAPAP